ncbi:hypothetical protein [Actinoplanes auranticolor]|nr:hypothetical protein [Actinoplanes auranticolor]
MTPGPAVREAGVAGLASEVAVVLGRAVRSAGRFGPACCAPSGGLRGRP